MMLLEVLLVTSDRAYLAALFLAFIIVGRLYGSELRRTSEQITNQIEKFKVYYN
jgi:hypothetical protein